MGYCLGLTRGYHGVLPATVTVHGVQGLLADTETVDHTGILPVL